MTNVKVKGSLLLSHSSQKSEPRNSQRLESKHIGVNP